MARDPRATMRETSTHLPTVVRERFASIDEIHADVIDQIDTALAEWRTASEQMYPKIRGTMVPADMFDEAVRLVTEYRSQRR